jgi:hypothetical protein
VREVEGGEPLLKRMRWLRGAILRLCYVYVK